jgi:hypothetical protein
MKDWRLCLRLRRALWQRYQESRSLTDPEVVAASDRLDRVVVGMMRDRVETSDTIAQDSALDEGAQHSSSIDKANPA